MRINEDYLDKVVTADDFDSAADNVDTEKNWEFQISFVPLKDIDMQIAFASVVKGKKKADSVVAWLVPGSWLVRQQIIDEGIDKILEEAGFELRLPSCSSCLAMNPDKVPAGKLSISTSNRNFVGRQGPGARTVLASPLVVAASAITGVITDPRKF
jgi:3-isopropylmalate/(R)-2-methylmalate dehydratase large subunit